MCPLLVCLLCVVDCVGGVWFSMRRCVCIGCMVQHTSLYLPFVGMV